MDSIKIYVNSIELSISVNAPFDEPVLIDAKEAQLIEKTKVTFTVSETQTAEERTFLSMLYGLNKLQNDYSPESSGKTASILYDYLFNHNGLINYISNIYRAPVSYLVSEIDTTSDADTFFSLPYVPGGVRPTVHLSYDDFTNLVVAKDYDKITGRNTTLSVKEIINFYANKKSDLIEDKLNFILKLRDNNFENTRNALQILFESITSSVIHSILPLVALVSQP